MNTTYTVKLIQKGLTLFIKRISVGVVYLFNR